MLARVYMHTSTCMYACTSHGKHTSFTFCIHTSNAYMCTSWCTLYIHVHTGTCKCVHVWIPNAQISYYIMYR